MGNIQNEYYQKLRQNLVFNPTPGQDELLMMLASYVFEENTDDIFLIRGYAGTGKTSILSALVRTLRSRRIPTVLMAPTGRAAKVLAAYSAFHASTIHRRIYFAMTAPDGSMMLTLQKNKLKNAVFLIDEASMIPDERADDNSGGRILLDDIMEYVFSGENCKLIFVGDIAQLPPVGLKVSPALNPVYLKNAYKNNVRKYELTEVVRQQQMSGILHNATKLRQVMLSKNYSFPFLDTYGFKDVIRISSAELLDEIISSYDLAGQDDTVIITRSNKRANQYNTAVRTQILQRENEIEAGDVLMVVKNNYFWLEASSGAGFLANGDLLEVMAITTTEEKHGFRFANIEARMIDYPDEPEINVKIILDTLSAEGPALSTAENNKLYNSVTASYAHITDRRELKQKVRNDEYFNALQIKFAYAMTCHKTQGGQWHTIFIDQGFISPENIDLDYLRWLYTAVTRATKRVYFINFPEEMFE
jgi:exodeoxyribonuclease-5